MPRSGRVPSVMGRNRFSEVPRADIPRSTFDRSHGHKTTFDAGYLVPVFVDEVLPGDTFNLRMTAFARMATPIKPLMDNMVLDSFFFFVPSRLVWEHWQQFNGERDDPDVGVDYLTPVVEWSGGTSGGNVGILDYLGLPEDVTFTEPLDINALPLRAYNLIWNEWFRDQNLQDKATVETDDGPDTAALYLLRKRGKRHDYFTSCLPWPQKGDAVVLPLGDTAPVVPDAAGEPFPRFGSTSGAGHLTIGIGGTGVATDPILAQTVTGGPLGAVALDWESSGLLADLSTATAATINELRQAFQVQKILERDARGGTRYTEIVKAHFGVTSPDARLQRPEYLGGGSTPVVISAVPQTSESEGAGAGTPQGNLAAYGTLNASGHGFVKSFTEHGYVLGLVSVRADLTYQQGLDRMWSRRTRFDYYWPALAHIGEQAVLRQEIYASALEADRETVFGYQERYAEYRYKPSLITGKFRSTNATSLDVWHLSQHFGGGETWDPVGPPTLSDGFIQENPPLDRVIAVPSEPHFLFDSFFQYRCARPMPVYGVPGLIDHF